MKQMCENKKEEKKKCTAVISIILITEMVRNPLVLRCDSAFHVSMVLYRQHIHPNQVHAMHFHGFLYDLEVICNLKW